MTATDPTATMRPDEPVEIWLGRGTRTEYVLVAWRDARGLVSYSMTRPGSSQEQSISNLQSKAIFPRKAVERWQRQVLEFLRHGLYDVTEVR